MKPINTIWITPTNFYSLIKTLKPKTMKKLITVLLLTIASTTFAQQNARGIKDNGVKQCGKCGVTSGRLAVNTYNKVVNEVKIYTLEGKLLINNKPNATNPEINIKTLAKGT